VIVAPPRRRLFPPSADPRRQFSHPIPRTTGQLWAMSDHMKRRTGDHLVYGPTGHIVYCAAIPAGSPCTNCTFTPLTITAVFSGVTVCTSCYTDFGSPNGSVQLSSSSFSGTFTLTQAGDPCIWTYDEDPMTSLSGSFWAGTATFCTGATNANGRLRLFAQRGSGNWFVSAEVLFSNSSSPLMSTKLTIFSVSTSAGSDCAVSTGALSNGISSSGYCGTDPAKWGNGGTVTLN
jgi:hypothetical protein